MSTQEWIKTFLFLIGAIGCLLVGFELLSTNLTKICHTSLKKLFNKTGKNDLVGVGIGAATTAIIQSSGATTVMIVGFVNTGVMSLHQAAAMIMGANIGTTVTAQLASLSSFDFGAYALSFAGIGIFLTMFAKKERTKTIGYALAGFGLIFLGLTEMSASMKVGAVKNAISGLLSSVNGPLAPFILFVLGIILTAIVQSSSLITTVVISLASVGIYIGSNTGSLNNNVLFLILGTNIGSCVTALISSVGSNVNAKRASTIHLLFNSFGAILFMIILFIFPHLMEDTLAKIFQGAPATQIAMFHTIFNVLCTLIFVPFIDMFVHLATKIVKEEEKEEKVLLHYIDLHMFKFPSVAIHQIRRELGLIYTESMNALTTSLEAFLERDEAKKAVVDEINASLEEKTKLIVSYIVKLTSEDLVFEDECTISSFHRSINDILRIGEIGDNITKYTHQMNEQNLEFSSEVMLQLGFLKQKINLLFEKTEEVFLTKEFNNLSEVDAIEETIDQMRKELISDHFVRLNKGECKPENSGVFVNLVNNLERSADHMTYIAHSVEDAYKEAHRK